MGGKGQKRARKELTGDTRFRYTQPSNNSSNNNNNNKRTRTFNDQSATTTTTSSTQNDSTNQSSSKRQQMLATTTTTTSSSSTLTNNSNSNKHQSSSSSSSSTNKKQQPIPTINDDEIDTSQYDIVDVKAPTTTTTTSRTANNNNNDDDLTPIVDSLPLPKIENLDVGTSIPGGGRKVIIILEEACFDVVKAKNGNFELLNCDDHLNLHHKLKRDPAHSRPDIAHQMLLCALDSPLNKVGLLSVYIRSAQGVLIEISPETRIPRTYKRFAGLIVQLLHKLRIRAKEGSKTLLRVIKNPITQYLPPNARKFSTSVKGTLVDVHEFVQHLDCDNTPVCFVFGAMAAGKINPNYVEHCLSFSEFPLSGAYALGRLLGAFERKWGVI
jgi:rRNA small subunit pseudouridine methyltransferase Nep1